MNLTNKYYLIVPFSFLFYGFMSSCSNDNQEMNLTPYESVPPSEYLILIDSLLLDQKESSLLYLERAKTLRKLNKKTETTQAFHEAIRQSYITQNEDVLMRSYYNLGEYYSFENHPITAKKYLNKSLYWSNSINNEAFRVTIRSELAHVKYQLDDVKGALQDLGEIVRFHQKYEDSAALCIIYNNMAVLYKKLGEFSKAIEYNFKSLNFSLAFNNNADIASSYNNIGNLYRVKKNYVLAETYLLKSKELSDLYNTKYNSPHVNLGELYLETDQLDKAKSVLLEAVQIEKKLRRKEKEKNQMELLLKVAENQREKFEIEKYSWKLDSLKNLIANEKRLDLLNNTN